MVFMKNNIIIYIIILLLIAPSVSLAKQPQDKKTCPVHQVKLQRGKAAIVHGLIRWDEEYYKAKENIFPFARTEINKGCYAPPWSKWDKTDRVYYCAECRAAKSAWLVEHGNRRR